MDRAARKDPPPVTLRQANRDDIGVLVELWKELTVHHTAIDAYYTLKPNAPETMAEYFGTRLEREDIILLAEDGDEVVGYLVAEKGSRPPVFEGGDVLIIAETLVKQGLRRSGIGRALVEEFFGIARDRKVSRVEVGYSADNQDGVAFWRKMGFRPFSVRASIDYA